MDNLNNMRTTTQSASFNCPNARNSNAPFFIGVAGGTSSGKSSVCEKIMEELGQVDVSLSQRKVVCISQDSFYKKIVGNLSRTNNYDHPNALDQDLLYKTLVEVLEGKITQVQLYDYVNNRPKEGEFVTIYPTDVVLFEGILAFYFPQIRDLFDMKLFVDTDADLRLLRRAERDVQERGRDLNTVLDHYMNFVKPAFEDYCLPTKKFADVIIPRGADNTVAISLIVQHIKDKWSSTFNSNSLSGFNKNNGQRTSKRGLVKELSRPH